MQTVEPEMENIRHKKKTCEKSTFFFFTWLLFLSYIFYFRSYLLETNQIINLSRQSYLKYRFFFMHRLFCIYIQISCADNLINLPNSFWPLGAHPFLLLDQTWHVQAHSNILNHLPINHFSFKHYIDLSLYMDIKVGITNNLNLGLV